MITKQAQDALISLSKLWAPDEACGYLVRVGEEFDRVLCYSNSSRSPQKNFNIRTTDYFDTMITHGFENVIIWHSHPTTRPNPSRDDLILMQQIKAKQLVIVGLYPIPMICLFEVEGMRVVQKQKIRAEVGV